MPQAYSDPKRESDPYALPNIEYFYVTEAEAAGHAKDGTEPAESGWYWWACFPGCVPDSDVFGPFATEEECIEDFTDEDLGDEEDGE